MSSSTHLINVIYIFVVNLCILFLYIFLYIFLYNPFSFVLIFSKTSFHRIALNLYFLNKFRAKERSKIYLCLLRLKTRQLLINGVAFVDCVDDRL